MLMKRFEGHVAFITGAGRGTGKTIAERFLSEGASVAAADLTRPSWMRESETFLPLACDVSNEKMVGEAWETAFRKFGTIDILVNNAGISIECPLTEMETDLWKKVFAINTDGVFYCARAAVRGMIESGKGGRIINIASIAGKNGFRNASAYGASKAAVIGFTRSLAAELGPFGITVNAVCPGSVDTPMIETVIQNIMAASGMEHDAVRKMMESEIPLRRFQTPEDVADLVCFLASDNAGNISGESINLDGGVVRD